MSEIKGKKCDQCEKIEMDKNQIKANWIEIQSICNDCNEKTQIFYPNHSISLEDMDFCSKECLIKYILGEKNVPEK